MKINLSCPVNNTGYGLASLNIIKELANISDLTYLPIGQPAVTSKEDYDLIFSLLSKKYSIDFDAPYIKIWHQFDLSEHIGKGKYYAYPFFELDTFNDYEIKNLRVPDHLFASSQWAKEVIAQNKIDSPVTVIPLGVNREIFNENVVCTRSDDKYVFLNIGKWEIRKGHDILLKLFRSAFPDEKDVELWILASEKTNNYSSPEELKQWKNMYETDNRVKLFSGFDTQNELAQLVANSNCGLYPSRAFSFSSILTK